MPSADRLLRLYPRNWRERYGEEFLAMLGGEPLHLQQVIDIVMAAVDAWLSADVRQAVQLGNMASNQGGSMTAQSLVVCGGTTFRATRRDGLIGAAVMIGVTVLLSAAGIAARRGGWLVTGETLKSVAFFVSLMLSMPLWLTKGQPWKAQAVIIGGTIALLVAISAAAALF